MNSDFQKAILKNSISVVRDLLHRGEPPSVEVCSLAIRTHATKVLKLLIEAGADVDAQEPLRGGETLLARSVREEFMEAFHLLLKSGASINKLGRRTAPVHVAAEDGLTKFVDACIAAGANIELRDRAGNTPLILAAAMGHTEVVKSLLRAGANPLSLNRVGQSACELAAGNNNSEVVRLLEPVSNQRRPRLKGVSAMIEAVTKADMDSMEKWLKKGFNVDARDQRGRSPMDRAIELGSIPMVRRLIDAGIDVNKVDPDGTSFLEKALRAEKWELAKILLHSGAVSNPPGNLLGDPIRSAIYSDDVALIKLLVAKGSDPKKPGVILDAAGAKLLNIVRYLLSSGADPNAMDPDGWTPLFWAVWVPRPPGLKSRKKWFLPKGATRASHPKLSTQKEMVRLLIKHGADVNHMNEQRQTALTLATSPSLVRLLKEAGVSKR